MDQLIELFSLDNLPAGSSLMLCENGKYTVKINGYPVIAVYDDDPLTAVEKSIEALGKFCAGLV